MDKIYLRKPTGSNRRCSYRLMHNNKTVASPELDSVNEALKLGEINKARAEEMAQEILQTYKKKNAPIVAAYLPENEEIARRYIAEVLALKTNRAPRAVEDRIMRAAKAVGKHSIRSAPLLDLRRALDKWEGRPYNDRVGALNQLMAFVGRRDRLPRKSEPLPNPRHLLLGEFERVVGHIDNLNVRTLCWAAFGTGARFGELFAISRMEQGQVYIPGQIKVIKTKNQKQLKMSVPKNKKTGWAAVIPAAEKWVKRWIELDPNIKNELRLLTKLSDTMRDVCQKEFPQQPDKWCTFHDLRHSYARYCLDNGKTLEDIREWLRDNMATVEKYYLGWGQGRRRGFL